MRGCEREKPGKKTAITRLNKKDQHGLRILYLECRSYNARKNMSQWRSGQPGFSQMARKPAVV